MIKLDDTNSQVIGVRISNEAVYSLAQIAKATNKVRTQLLREAVDDFIAEHAPVKP